MKWVVREQRLILHLLVQVQPSPSAECLLLDDAPHNLADCPRVKREWFVLLRGGLEAAAAGHGAREGSLPYNSDRL